MLPVRPINKGAPNQEKNTIKKHVVKISVSAGMAVLFSVSGSYAGGSALESLKESVSPSGLSAITLPVASKGYAAGNDTAAATPTQAVEFVRIPGGTFTMGSEAIDFNDTKPIREVAIKTFDMSKTAVTVEQYAECVIKGGCTEAATGDNCNWGAPGRALHPVNCVDWDQASAYAKFKGARLPSESEWEYAATSGGKSQKYPWGNDEPTCEKAVMYGNGNSVAAKKARCLCALSLPATPCRVCVIWRGMSGSGCRISTGIHIKARLLTALPMKVRAPSG